MLWFGLYAKPVETDLPDPNYAAYMLADPEPCISRAEYDQAIGRVKRYIESGDTYQVNYTLRLHAAFHGDPWHLFLAMVRAQIDSRFQIPDSRLKPQIRNPESGIGIGIAQQVMPRMSIRGVMPYALLRPNSSFGSKAVS